MSCELPPLLAVATLWAGSDSVPRTTPVPFTSSVAAGVDVFTPTLPVEPLPDWNRTEFSMSLALVNSGIKLAVPAPVTLPSGGGVEAGAFVGLVLSDGTADREEDG